MLMVHYQWSVQLRIAQFVVLQSDLKKKQGIKKNSGGEGGGSARPRATPWIRLWISYVLIVGLNQCDAMLQAKPMQRVRNTNAKFTCICKCWQRKLGDLCSRWGVSCLFLEKQNYYTKKRNLINSALLILRANKKSLVWKYIKIFVQKKR